MTFGFPQAARRRNLPASGAVDDCPIVRFLPGDCARASDPPTHRRSSACLPAGPAAQPETLQGQAKLRSYILILRHTREVRRCVIRFEIPPSLKGPPGHRFRRHQIKIENQQRTRAPIRCFVPLDGRNSLPKANLVANYPVEGAPLQQFVLPPGHGPGAMPRSRIESPGATGCGALYLPPYEFRRRIDANT